MNIALQTWWQAILMLTILTKRLHNFRCVHITSVHASCTRLHLCVWRRFVSANLQMTYALLLIPLTVAGRTIAAICPILRSLAVLPVMYVFGPWRSASNCVLPEIPKTYIEWEAPWSNIDQLLNAEVRCALNHFFTIEHNKTVYNVFWTVHWHVLGYLKMKSILCSQDLAYWRRT